MNVFLVMIESEDGYGSEVEAVYLNEEEAEKAVETINKQTDCNAYVESKEVVDA